MEDYNTVDKIRIFMQSDIILSSHSGALTFTIFCNKKTKIIEILNHGTIGFPHSHYEINSRSLDLQYYKYSNIIEDDLGNFCLNFDEFEKYLQNLI